MAEEALRFTIQVDKNTGAISLVGREFDDLKGKVGQTGDALGGLGSQFAALAPSREFLATIGGNGTAVGIAVGVGCIVSAIAAKVDDHNKSQEPGQ